MAAMPWTQRDVSWLQFNERVLAQAMRADRPLLERCRFLGITAENLDEFIAVRLAKRRSKPDTAEKRRIDLVLQRSVETFVWRQQACWEQLKEQLAAVGIRLLSEKQWDIRQRQATAEIFQTRIMPLLTPFTVDAAHPFPYLASGQLAIALLQPHKPEMVVLPLPVSLPRLFSLPCDNGRAFVLLEDVVQRFLFARFPEEPGRQMTVFRLLRSAAETLLPGADDLCRATRELLSRRRSGSVIRLETTADKGLLHTLLLGYAKTDPSNGTAACPRLDLRFCRQLADRLPLPALRWPAWRCAPAEDFWGEADPFAAIRRRDRLAFHPFEDFDCILRFLQQAAADPAVRLIEQTLYRVSEPSSVVDALCCAAKSGKTVVVLVELQARFDEAHNLQVVKRLLHSGCQVVYGTAGRKTHAKLLLVVRREGEILRRYAHIGTGNYNEVTAQQYTDIGLFTAREGYTADMAAVFAHLTGSSHLPPLRSLVAAPMGLREFLYQRIADEIAYAQQGRACGIFAKVNALTDRPLIARLYAASAAGVPITLVVRGACCLRAGVPGLSSTIRVYSLIGRLLEHSRIFRFGGPERARYYIGSADWMSRNLDRRVEVLTPVEEKHAVMRLERYINRMLSDTVNRWEMQPDGHYARVAPDGKNVDSQCENRIPDDLKNEFSILIDNNIKC